VRPAGGMLGRVKLWRNGSVEPFFKFVSFLTGDFKVKHQVFDVESKLGERFLNE